MAETSAVGAQLGPRIIGRLTAELVLRSPQYMNPCNQYEIDLRANRIAAIENLGTTEVRGVRLGPPPPPPPPPITSAAVATDLACAALPTCLPRAEPV